MCVVYWGGVVFNVRFCPVNIFFPYYICTSVGYTACWHKADGIVVVNISSSSSSSSSPDGYSQRFNCCLFLLCLDFCSGGYLHSCSITHYNTASYVCSRSTLCMHRTPEPLKVLPAYRCSLRRGLFVEGLVHAILLHDARTFCVISYVY